MSLLRSCFFPWSDQGYEQEPIEDLCFETSEARADQFLTAVTL